MPNENTLLAHLNRDSNTYKEELHKLYTKQTEMEEKVIDELVEIKRDRNDQTEADLFFFDETTRLDSMKINSMEIILSFQQSAYVPVSNIMNFVMGTEQSLKGFPLLD